MKKDAHADEITRLRDRIREFEALIAEWGHHDDPESLWILRLLREGIEERRARLSAMAPARPEG